MPHDISTEADIRRLVDTFYDRVNQDKALGPIFNDVAKVDWSKHLPTMYEFWGTLLLGTKSYRGQPFPKHAVLLDLDRTHFAKWLALFNTTLHELFEGPVAEHAEYRAGMIANVFQSRLGLATPLPIVMAK